MNLQYLNYEQQPNGNFVPDEKNTITLNLLKRGDFKIVENDKNEHDETTK